MLIHLQNFGGMIPAKDASNLPENNAAYARNTWLYEGSLQGWRVPKAVYNCLHGTTKKAVRLPIDTSAPPNWINSVWVESDNEFFSAIRAPIANDSYRRFYLFTPGSAPLYTTLNDIRNNVAPTTLGIPTPTTAPTVTHVANSSNHSPVNEVRSYVYTWISQYGEEGPPSPPTVVTGTVDGTWNITVTAPSSADITGRRLTTTRIYKTITTTSGTAEFYFLAEFPISTYSLHDITPASEMTGNNTLHSTGWTAPPALQGVTMMANGIIAGWANDRDVYFSEPYRPHAWPASYSISVDYPIVGMAAVGTMLVILTTGTPYTCTGNTPSTMVLQNLQVYEPCVSRGSITTCSSGVLYASMNGLMLVKSSGVSNVASSYVTPKSWMGERPQFFAAGRFNDAYVAFRKQDASVDNGIVMDAASEDVAYHRISTGNVVTSAHNDEESGMLMFLAGGTVYIWDSADATDMIAQMPYLWRSKKFMFPYDHAFYGVRVKFDVPATVTIPAPTDTTRTANYGHSFDRTTQYLLLRVYCDDKIIFTKEVISPRDISLIPSGVRGAYWQFELEGQVSVSNLQAGTSIKELRKS